MRRHTRWFLAAAAAGLLFTASSAQASPINVNDPLWYEFGFGAPPGAATACTAATCVPSSGGNSQFVGDPAWTFVLGAGGGAITVTDAFLNTDRYEIFDNLVSLGLTSVPSGTGACGDNPVPCLADPLSSHGIFALGGGAHSITINHLIGSTGAAYFRVDSAVAAVPEPATFGLLGLGVLALAAKARARRRHAPVNG